MKSPVYTDLVVANRSGALDTNSVAHEAMPSVKTHFVGLGEVAPIVEQIRALSICSARLVSISAEVARWSREHDTEDWTDPEASTATVARGRPSPKSGRGSKKPRRRGVRSEPRPSLSARTKPHTPGKKPRARRSLYDQARKRAGVGADLSLLGSIIQPFVISRPAPSPFITWFESMLKRQFSDIPRHETNPVLQEMLMALAERLQEAGRTGSLVGVVEEIGQAVQQMMAFPRVGGFGERRTAVLVDDYANSQIIQHRGSGFTSSVFRRRHLRADFFICAQTLPSINRDIRRQANDIFLFPMMAEDDLRNLTMFSLPLPLDMTIHHYLTATDPSIPRNERYLWISLQAHQLRRGLLHPIHSPRAVEGEPPPPSIPHIPQRPAE